ncbi:DUF4384 domain-containing protein [candidate division KSB1 bacterium]|nr:DUF4384 domain-containing protein [candidate division KSB1 bacterium]
MKILKLICIVLLLLGWTTARSASPFTPVGFSDPDEPLQVEVWQAREDGAVYQPGEPVTIFFRADRDCYITLYNIDTEGQMHLLYPLAATQSNFISGGVTYCIPDNYFGFQYVANGPEGIEYISAVATLHPHPVPAWLRVHPSLRRGVFHQYEQGEYVTYDPYLAMDDIALRIVSVFPEPIYYTQDFTVLYVSAPVYYPRYLCYNCHANRRYRPYTDVCVHYQIWVDVSWDYNPIYLKTRHPFGFWKYRKRLEPYRVHAPRDRVRIAPGPPTKNYRHGYDNIGMKRRVDNKDPILHFKRPKTPEKKPVLRRDIKKKAVQKYVPPPNVRTHPKKKDDNAADKHPSTKKQIRTKPPIPEKPDNPKPAIPVQRKKRVESDRAKKQPVQQNDRRIKPDSDRKKAAPESRTTKANDSNKTTSKKSETKRRQKKTE